MGESDLRSQHDVGHGKRCRDHHIAVDDRLDVSDDRGRRAAYAVDAGSAP